MKKFRTYIIFFLLAFCFSYFGIINFERIKALFTIDNSEYLYTPNYDNDNIQEIILIYIGSSRCKFSNSKKLYKSVDAIKSLINDKATKNNVGFTTIGIAAELHPTSGINHLNNFGYFDEVISGNGWSNNGIIKYAGEMGVEASTPQIILTYRRYSESRRFNIIEEKIVSSLKGERQILNWHEKGAPLPQNFIKEL